MLILTTKRTASSTGLPFKGQLEVMCRRSILSHALGRIQKEMWAISSPLQKKGVSHFFNGPILVSEVIYGMQPGLQKVGGLCRGEVLTHSTSGQSQFLQLDLRQPTDYTRHISSFLTWVPFFSSLSTAHFISASLHHRSICNVNWETRGSFSFGLVCGRIRRGIQNVLTQINGTNKSKISLAT